MDPLQAFRLDGRVVVITGASAGLGAGFARAVAAVGGTLVLAARRADLLKGVADSLTADGATVFARVTDVSDPDDCAALVAEAHERLGRIDALVNNAGVGQAVPALRNKPEDFRHVIDINLNGTFWMAQACASVMQPGSAIVNVSSVLGMVASRFPQAAYSASKAGVIGLTRDLAQQWSGRRGIRVNALCPGYFATDMIADGLTQISESVAAHSMLGRLGEQADLDPALLFLISDASAYVTGTTLLVDGGMGAL